MIGPRLITLHGDLRTVLFPEELIGQIDAVVTSPPYKTEDGYSAELMHSLGILAEYVLKPGGRFFMNFGQLRSDFNRIYEAQAAVVGTAEELRVGQTIIWAKSIAVPTWREQVRELLDDDATFVSKDVLRKILNGPGEVLQRGHYQPLRSDKLLNYCHEMIFTFFKEFEQPLDRLALGVPYADKSNLKRDTRGKNGDLHCGGDIWFVPYKTTGRTKKKKHRYEFPEPLVERCLRLCNIEPGGTVFEPFCGSGTTAVVAKMLGLNCVTLDIDSGNLAAARERWNEA